MASHLSDSAPQNYVGDKLKYDIMLMSSQYSWQKFVSNTHSEWWGTEPLKWDMNVLPKWNGTSEDLEKEKEETNLTSGLV
jgi:hypothetical protein